MCIAYVFIYYTQYAYTVYGMVYYIRLAIRARYLPQIGTVRYRYIPVLGMLYTVLYTIGKLYTGGSPMLRWTLPLPYKASRVLP